MGRSLAKSGLTFDVLMWLVMRLKTVFKAFNI